MKLLNFAVIKLTVCLILGIILSYYFEISLYIALSLSALCSTFLLLFLILAKKQFKETVWFGLTAYATLISIGILTTSAHNQQNFKNHYSYFISSNNKALSTITFRVREVLKPGTYHDKYVVDILEIDSNKVKGKSLLNIEKDSLISPLHVDDLLVSRTPFKDLKPPLNPHQFDYKNYLAKQYIYHQIFEKNSSLLKVESNTKTLLGLADKIRQHINTKLKSYHFKPDQLAIINALLLGQRQDISKTVYTHYTNAGAIHILAVSGLHIGIILLILSYLLKPLEHFKHGKIIKTILLVGLLWSFAIIAGLSASVTRAVTMFSIITIAANLKRPTNLYNTLAISMFVILLFKPLFLFDVGFQLSYLAVFSIVTIDPHLYKLWQPKNKILDIYWHTLTVTIAAQIGIAPLSLYYFHQFPSLFFVSNLVIIPLLGVVLGLGIIIIILGIINILPQFLADLYGSIISVMNAFIGWISHQETFLFKDISFSILNLLMSYLLIISIYQFSTKRNPQTLTFFLISVLIIQTALIFNKANPSSDEFIVFHKSRFSLLGHKTDHKICVAHNFENETATTNNIIKNYVVENHLETIEEDSIRNIYQINNKYLFIVDHLGIYNIKSIKPEYVLLRESPKLNLNRLIDSLKPKYIIADGSNYKSYINQWETICKERKLPFHQTNKQGAFIIKY
ncbi:ComEC/Rec2 family competence protein [Tamlana sp. I1]|uniref:ComEC/Rec2 family competence protein n=1 Tax=Tamlana sp. I1 TaxID=2762061 RepID=UPI00188E2696|nr:ComEC/Rec2 family competence protein [Tamlana sp. I1]